MIKRTAVRRTKNRITMGIKKRGKKEIVNKSWVEKYDWMEWLMIEKSDDYHKSNKSK